MASLEPTPERLAAARRCAERNILVGPEGASPYYDANPELLTLCSYGLAVLHFTPAHQRTDDYFTLTDAGRAWLDQHSKEER